MSLPISSYRDLLAAYLRTERGRLFWLALLLLAGIGLQLVSPQIIRYFIDTAQANGAQRGLVLAAAGYLAAGAFQRGFGLATLYVSENLGWSATNALRGDLLRHCLRLDMPFHKQHTPGELIERIDGDVTALATFFSQFVIRIAGNALFLVAVVLVLAREDWRIGLVLAAYLAVTLAVLLRTQNLARPHWAAERQASAELFGFIEERISGTEDIRSSGAEAHTLSHLRDRLTGQAQAQVAAWTANALTFTVANVLGLLGTVLALALGGYLHLQGRISLGTTYLVVSYVALLAMPLEDIRQQVQGLGQAQASMARVLALFRQTSQVREAARRALPAGPLPVALDHVTFAYDDPPVGTPMAAGRGMAGLAVALRDVTLQLPAGRVLGLLGRTGSGKTTLTRLLFRLYDPQRGLVRLGSHDVRDLSLDDLRSRVGMVTQEVQLFQASVRDNLAFFDRRITDDQVGDALRKLELWDWVQSLPAGLDTLLGPGGQGLSAGEAQLLAFTRVFLKDPGLVLLDEASSRLDPATARLLERALDRLLAGRTAIIIAHRLETVDRADDILILEDGHVAEFGSRGQLAADARSRFYGLLQTGLQEALA